MTSDATTCPRRGANFNRTGLGMVTVLLTVLVILALFIEASDCWLWARLGPNARPHAGIVLAVATIAALIPITNFAGLVP